MRRKKRTVVPADTRHMVMARTQWRCACGCGRACGVPLHHVFPVQRHPDLALEPDNLLAVNPTCHARHEAAFARLPRHAVSRAEHLATTPAMVAFLDRTYA